MFYVYKITNKVNGKVYIGKTNDVNKRWAEHVRVSSPTNKKNRVISQAIAKYGKENFTIESVESFDSEAQCLAREVYWITFHKSNICKYGNSYGYNLTDGGEGASGSKPSQEARKRMSDSHIGLQAGEKHPLTDLTIDDIHNIFRMIILGQKDQEIATQFSLARKTISNIRLGKSWKEVPRPSEMKLLSCPGKRVLLTDVEVHQIETLLLNGEMGTVISKQFRIANSTVSNIKKRLLEKKLKA